MYSWGFIPHGIRKWLFAPPPPDKILNAALRFLGDFTSDLSMPRCFVIMQLMRGRDVLHDVGGCREGWVVERHGCWKFVILQPFCSGFFTFMTFFHPYTPKCLRKIFVVLYGRASYFCESPFMRVINKKMWSVFSLDPFSIASSTPPMPSISIFLWVW